jgi:hypothetical protein
VTLWFNSSHELFYDLYFIAFLWVHLLVYIVNIRMCLEWVT